MTSGDATVRGQDALWEHFQTDGLESFGDSEARLGFLTGLLPPRSTVLNIGVGGGLLERRAIEMGHDVYALDPGPQSIEALRDRLRLGDHARVGRITAIPFDAGIFGVVVASEVLEHLDDGTLQAGLAEVHRVLRPGGMFIGTVPRDEDLGLSTVICPSCGERFHRWGHQQTFSETRLREVLESQFGVERLESRRFVPWRRRNWRGRLIELSRIVRMRVGRHGPNENILFVARRI